MGADVGIDKSTKEASIFRPKRKSRSADHKQTFSRGSRHATTRFPSALRNLCVISPEAGQGNPIASLLSRTDLRRMMLGSAMACRSNYTATTTLDEAG